jgi:NTE family protein
LLRADVPRTAREIINRIDEVSFNSAFVTELAAIAFIEQVYGSAAATDRVRNMYMHIINDRALDALGASSKMNNGRAFLEYLRKVGWNAAEDWLKANLRFIGKRSTVDLSGLLPLQDGLFTDPIGIRQRLQTSDQIVPGTR